MVQMPDDTPSAPEPTESDRGDPQEPQLDAGADAGPRSAGSNEPRPSPALAEGGSPSSPESGPRDFRPEIIVQVGHEDDPDDLIDKVAEGEALFDGGDFRSAQNTFGEVLSESPSPEMRRFVEGRLKRIKPDRIALLVAAACAIGVSIIWFFAVRAG